MGTIVALLLSLCCCVCWAESKVITDEITQHQQADIWNEVKVLRDVLVDMAGRLKSTEELVTDLRALGKAQSDELEAMGTRLNASESLAEKLMEEIQGRKVAFSVGSTGSAGPSVHDITLTYRNILTNIGNAYNPITGIFTAPVKGVYYFTSFGHGAPVYIGAVLMKNGKRVVCTTEYQSPGDHDDYSSNAAVLQLDIGDVVNIAVTHPYTLHGHEENRNTFSGFLLFL